MSAGQGAGRMEISVSVLEGMTVYPARPAGHQAAAGPGIRVLRGAGDEIPFDDAALSKHVLFLGAIGTGKTTAMMQLVRELRRTAGPDDVFVVFDTKGDFLGEFYAGGDAVVGAAPPRGGVVWNVFADLLETDEAARADQIYEVSSTIFSEGLSRAGENFFFAAAARDIFAAAVAALSREGTAYSNADLRERLEGSQEDLQDLLGQHDGTSRYLEDEQAAKPILAFLQQTLNTAFSGPFRGAGKFSIREFVRAKSGRALFVEYDIAIGSRLLPVYRVLMDMAIKEALDIGRRGGRGNVFFVLDEFALLPALSHIGDGINFGRGLGLKFIVGSQNVGQVLSAYGAEAGRSILSGFGTVFAFRLMDHGSRELLQQRFGANRKQITTFAPVRSAGVQQTVVRGSVIEDWALSGLRVGQCIVALPEGPPFFFSFGRHPG